MGLVSSSGYQRADCSIHRGIEGGFQCRLHTNDSSDAGVVGHAGAAEVFDDEADGDGKAGFYDAHAGGVADEE